MSLGLGRSEGKVIKEKTSKTFIVYPPYPSLGDEHKREESLMRLGEVDDIFEPHGDFEVN